MNTTLPLTHFSRLFMISAALATSACTTYVAPYPPPRVIAAPAPVATYYSLGPQSVVSVYVDPPVMQPAPILIGWAPPPLLVQVPVPMPYPGAVWTGGYWIWEGNWVWSAGRWLAPPLPNYGWVQPYYEYRNAGVVFITGHWSPPGVFFAPPPINLNLTLATPLVGVVAGPLPIGPLGVFVPAPPGSRVGIIVPAPIGTAPAVVAGAASVVNVGMRVRNNITTINNTQVTNTVNNNNVTTVTVVAPATATANGQAFQSVVPAQAQLAAALPARVQAVAPMPFSGRAIPAFTANRPPVTLPEAQLVHNSAAAASMAQQRDAAAGAQKALGAPPGNPTVSSAVQPAPAREKSVAAPEPVKVEQVARNPNTARSASAATAIAQPQQPSTQPVTPSRGERLPKADQRRQNVTAGPARDMNPQPKMKKREESRPQEKAGKGEKAESKSR